MRSGKGIQRSRIGQPTSTTDTVMYMYRVFHVSHGPITHHGLDEVYPPLPLFKHVRSLESVGALDQGLLHGGWVQEPPAVVLGDDGCKEADSPGDHRGRHAGPAEAAAPGLDL